MPVPITEFCSSTEIDTHWRCEVPAGCVGCCSPSILFRIKAAAPFFANIEPGRKSTCLKSKNPRQVNPASRLSFPSPNEERIVFLLYQRICDACEPLGLRYDVVFIDDGSRDHTFEVLSGIHEQDSRAKVIRFRRSARNSSCCRSSFFCSAWGC